MLLFCPERASRCDAPRLVVCRCVQLPVGSVTRVEVVGHSLGSGVASLVRALFGGYSVTTCAGFAWMLAVLMAFRCMLLQLMSCGHPHRRSSKRGRLHGRGDTQLLAACGTSRVRWPSNTQSASSTRTISCLGCRMEASSPCSRRRCVALTALCFVRTPLPLLSPRPLPPERLRLYSNAVPSPRALNCSVASSHPPRPLPVLARLTVRVLHGTPRVHPSVDNVAIVAPSVSRRGRGGEGNAPAWPDHLAQPRQRRAGGGPRSLWLHKLRERQVRPPRVLCLE